jgi:outer membrane immunogenic protein
MKTLPYKSQSPLIMSNSHPAMLRGDLQMKSMAIGLLAAAAFGIGFGQTALAAEMPVKAPGGPPAAAPLDWSGWYIGANGGWVQGTVEHDVTVASNGVSGVGGVFFDAGNILPVQSVGSGQIIGTGSLVGGQIGYQRQNGPVIWGIEFDYQGVKLNGSRPAAGLYGVGIGAPAGFAFNPRFSTDWLTTLRGRFGVDPGYNLLLYLTAGAALADLKYSNSFLDTFYTPGGAGAVAFSETKFGFAGGLGVEWALSDHWRLRGEYLHVMFNEVTTRNWIMLTPGAGPGCGPCAALFTSRVTDFSEDILRGAINYRM